MKFYPEILKERYSEATRLFIKTIAHRIYRQNKNALIITCGASGTGKSYVDLELMRGIYAYVRGEYPSDEEVVGRTFFKLREFLKILNTEEIRDGKLSKGQIFISEEVGTQASNRTHQNIANRSYSFIVQTFRAKGMILFFNVPSFNFVDSQIRKQLHFLIETKQINKTKKICVCRPLALQYNSRMDKIYYHSIVTQNEKREAMEIQLIGLPKIPDSLEKLYEERKSEFINALNSSLQEKLDSIEEKETKEITIKKDLSPTQKLAYDLNQQGKSDEEIGKILGRNKITIYKLLRFCKKKGWEVINTKKPSRSRHFQPKTPATTLLFPVSEKNEKKK